MVKESKHTQIHTQIHTESELSLTQLVLCLEVTSATKR